MKKLFKRFLKNQNGNFSLMFAFGVTLIMVSVSAAIELTRLSSAQNRLQSVTDMAALAGAIAADGRDVDREAIARDVFLENMDEIGAMTIAGEPNIVFDDQTKIISVNVQTEFKSVLTGFLGKKALKVSATSESLYAPEAIAPITIAFALDVSGSMGSNTPDGDVKLDTLKDSIEVLFTSLESGSKDKTKLNEALRTGMSAYNTALVDDFDMDYGWEDLADSVDSLVASGGTNSVPALQNSYNQILEDRDFRVSQGQDISDLVEYVIFMTDGVNNQPEWNTESIAICEAMKADGIDLYSIAFAAPEIGEALLLDCASSNAGPPSGDDDDDDENKCMNNGANGDGQALGHCTGDDKEEIEDGKSRYYFDASDSEAFKSAFDKIGESIAQVYIRIL